MIERSVVVCQLLSASCQAPGSKQWRRFMLFDRYKMKFILGNCFPLFNEARDPVIAFTAVTLWRLDGNRNISLPTRVIEKFCKLYIERILTARF